MLNFICVCVCVCGNAVLNAKLSNFAIEYIREIIEIILKAVYPVNCKGATPKNIYL